MCILTNDAKTQSKLQDNPESGSKRDSSRCPICEHTELVGLYRYADDKGYVVQLGAKEQGAASGAALSVRVCSFCKLLFPDVVPVVPELSELEMMGAWYHFTEDLVQYAGDIWREALRERREQYRVTPPLLRRWAVGLKHEEVWDVDENNTLLDDFQGAALRGVAYERLLHLVEPAYAVADDLYHRWKVEAVREAINDPAIARVWQSWLGSHAHEGKALSDNLRRVRRQTNWHEDGVKYNTPCLEWGQE